MVISVDDAREEIITKTNFSWSDHELSIHIFKFLNLYKILEKIRVFASKLNRGTQGFECKGSREFINEKSNKTLRSLHPKQREESIRKSYKPN